MRMDERAIPLQSFTPGIPGWLGALRNQLAEVSYEAAQEYFPIPGYRGEAYYNYRLEHVKQVERQAVALLTEVGGDTEVVMAAVWLHDLFQPGFSGEKHGPRAAIWAAGKLKPLGFPAEKIDAVCFAVSRHSDPPGTLPEEAHEARILWDADKLTHVGPFETITDLINYLAADRVRKIHQEYGTLSVETIFRNSLGKFSGKNTSVPQFYFEISRRWAEDRLRVQQEFYECCRQQMGLQKELGAV